MRAKAIIDAREISPFTNTTLKPSAGDIGPFSSLCAVSTALEPSFLVRIFPFFPSSEISFSDANSSHQRPNTRLTFVNRGMGEMVGSVQQIPPQRKDWLLSRDLWHDWCSDHTVVDLHNLAFDHQHGSEIGKQTACDFVGDCVEV